MGEGLSPLDKQSFTREEFINELDRAIDEKRKEWVKDASLLKVEEGLGQIQVGFRGVRGRLSKIEKKQLVLEASLERSNHLKETLATKEEVVTWMGELRTGVEREIGEIKAILENKRFITVEMLDEHDFWVKEGIPSDMTPEEIEAVRELGRENARRKDQQEKAEKALRSRQLRVSIVIPVIAVLLTAIGTTIAILTFLNNLHPHITK